MARSPDAVEEGSSWHWVAMLTDQGKYLVRVAELLAVAYTWVAVATYGNTLGVSGYLVVPLVFKTSGNPDVTRT